MATVAISLCVSNARVQQQPVVDDVPVATNAAITSSGTSQASSITASQQGGADVFWCVTSVGGAVWVTFAAAPVAASGTTFLVADGATLWVRATPGNKCAVID